jgi:hypothetical protein
MLRQCFDTTDSTLANVAGVVFLATPHTGSGLATMAKLLPRFLRPSSHVFELVGSSPDLRNLNSWYRQNVGKLHIKTKVFYEKIGFFGKLIVAEDRADPGIIDVIPIATGENHFSICKPDTRENLVFRSVVEFVQECLTAPLPISQQVTLETAKPSVNIFFGAVYNQTTFIAGNVGITKKAVSPKQTLSTLNAATSDPAQVADIAPPDNNILQQLAAQHEAKASNWIDKLEFYLDIDFPMACSTAQEIETWIQQNGDIITKPAKVKLYNQLARVEITKVKRNMTGSDIDRVEYFLKEAKK